MRGLPECALALDPFALEHAVLLVVDIDSPDPRGLALCDRLGAKLRTPFIALLRWEDPNLTTAVLDRGATDCLARPFNPEELGLRIRAILTRTGAMPPPATFPSLLEGSQKTSPSSMPRIVTPSSSFLHRLPAMLFPWRASTGPRRRIEEKGFSK